MPLKHRREQYSSFTPNISLRVRENSQQPEVGGPGAPPKRRKVGNEAEPSEKPLGDKHAIQTKKEVDIKENINLGTRMEDTQGVTSHLGNVEVIDLLDDEDDEDEIDLTEREAVIETKAEKHRQPILSPPSSNVPNAGVNNVPPRGIKSKSSSEAKAKVNEDDEINQAANCILRSAMPDLDDDETSWMDQIIHSRPSVNGAANRIEVDTLGNVQLTQEEIMNYLTNLENRPGHVKRRGRLMKAKDLHREGWEADNKGTAMGEVLTGTATSAGPELSSQDAIPNRDEGGEEVDPIQEEKDRVVEAARRLHCRRKRKIVTRREEVLDDTVPDGVKSEGSTEDMKVEISAVGMKVEARPDGVKVEAPAVSMKVEAQAENVKIKFEPEDLVIIAEGPDGRPRRYRRIEELKSFWTVPGMTTPLLDHQILGVDWMVNDKERSEKGLHGGLVADMMGLGKTMQAIATMVLNKPPSDSGPKDPHVTLIVVPAALVHQWKEEIKQHTKEGEFNIFVHHGSNKIKSLQHLRNQDVVITSYHTIMNSHPKMKRPSRHMSKEEVSAWWEEQWETRKEFHRIKFWRVILDESACTSLRAVHKWAISGTPIQNSLFDMYPIFRFLGNRFSELPVFKSIFGITRYNGAARAAKAMQVELAHIMMRRNKEDMLCGRKLLDLTPKAVSTIEVEFSQEERALYRVVEAKTIQQVNDLRRNVGGDNEFYLTALVLLMRLRQICNHPYLIMDAIKKDFSIDDLKAALEQEAVNNPVCESDDDEDLPENIMGAISQQRPVTGASSGLRQILQIAQTEAAGETGTCFICMDIPEDPVMTNCRHVFCQGCITSVIQRAAMDEGDGAKCPSCQREITDQELRAYLPDQDEADGSGESLHNNHWLDQVKTLMPSAKMEALMKQVRSLVHPRLSVLPPTYKLNTQIKMLDLVDLICQDDGYETVRYTGGTSLKQRDDALKRFKHDPDYPIMLTSLRAGGVGLNLTQANLVISIDMWWNAAVEHQAFDRVHRLGQIKEVYVKRFIVKETVEERIKVLQEGKLKVAAAAMGEGLGRVKRLGMKELMGLFGKVVRGEDGIDMVVQAN
ncbi:hypothetical protein FGG08_002895 [Glutinoglossum americanum]|uniref:Uncharacterized protein n=1 Tax=Glutinoglossum americanum TaxID=1670608 RepID=A0A9P8I8T5_9PEZI|nr:hypothetical protein FGG08_002895 [Glutinoglossum americanum]